MVESTFNTGEASKKKNYWPKLLRVSNCEIPALNV